ncbi:unnamed protein product [Natator depressus]
MPQDKWMEIKAAAELSFAQLYQCHKRSEDAILCCQKALSYIEKSEGESNLECIPVHKKMAGVARVLGDHATAIQHLVKSVSLMPFSCLFSPVSYKEYVPRNVEEGNFIFFQAGSFHCTEKKPFFRGSSRNCSLGDTGCSFL